MRILTQGLKQLSLKLTSEGVKSFKVTSTKNGMSSSGQVYLQHILSNLSFSGTPEAHAVGKSSNVSLISHLNTNGTYQWLFNDTNYTTTVPWVMYTCPKPGKWSTTMFGSNCMSLSYAICEIFCQEEINGLEFAKNGLVTTAEKEQTKINFLLRNGSHVNITIDSGDGSGLKYLTDSKVSGAILVASMNKTYASKGVYTVNITACNLLGCKSTVGNITIQSKIANLTFYSPPCSATNSSINFTASMAAGCDPLYSWTVENQTYKTGSQAWFSYTYKKAGLHTMTLVAYNNVSTALTSCKEIVVKDTIEGVQVGPVADSGIPQIANIPYKVGGGSDVKVSICYGDSVCESPSSNFSAEGTVIYSGSFSHNYTKGGDYVANLTFCNCVGCNSTTVNVHVEIPVAGPKMSIGRKTAPTINVAACSAPMYVLVNEKVFMVADVSNGTNVKVTWEFGDGFNATDYHDGEFHESGAHANHSYSSSGNYTITVKLVNQNGQKDFKCHIVAQDPILALEMSSNSPQGIPDGSLSISTKTSGTRPSDPIHCVMQFGDGNSSGSLPMSYDTPQTVVNTNKYPSAAFYNATINCSNAVSWAAKSITVELQDKIYGSQVETFGIAPQAKHDIVVGEGYNGPGERGNIYPLEHEIRFFTQTSNGTNKTCIHCFSCGTAEQVIKNTTCGNVTHKFTTPGNKTTTITIKNDVSSQVVSIVVNVEESIVCTPITDPGPQARTLPHIFKPAPAKVGPNWCCLFKYGDKTKADYYVPTTSKCKADLISLDGIATSINPKKTFEGSTFDVNHTFPAVGEYLNSMYCWNRVSQCTTDIKAVVVNKPCKQPIVTIPDLNPNITTPTESKKSELKTIRTKNVVDCEASLNRSFVWVFSLIDNKTKTETKANLSGVDTNEEFITLPQRKLNVGLYKVCFTLNLTEMIGVAGTTCSYLKIIQSPLKVELKGGSLIAVGFNKSMTLNGIQSQDVDTELTVEKDKDLTCYFFCKAEGENYTFPASFNQNNVPAVPAVRPIPVNNTQNMTYLGGCYGDGPGRLKSDLLKCSVDLFTGRMLENTTYIMRMYMLHKDGRFGHTEQKWQVKQGDPPSMSIA